MAGDTAKKGGSNHFGAANYGDTNKRIGGAGDWDPKGWGRGDDRCYRNVKSLRLSVRKVA